MNRINFLDAMGGFGMGRPGRTRSRLQFSWLLASVPLTQRIPPIAKHSTHEYVISCFFHKLHVVVSTAIDVIVII